MVNKRWAFVLIALCLLWRFFRFTLDFPIWGDEAMLAINFVDNSFGDLFSPLEYGQIGPLGWLWLEKLMFDLGDGEVMWMRLPALLAGFYSVFVFWGIANKILDSTSALLALAVFCASYYLVRYSVEIKPYSFDLLVALLLIRSGLDRAVARFFWIATIGVFFSLPSMFVAAGVGLFLFHRLKSKRLLLAVVGVAIIIEYIWMTMKFTSVHSSAASWLREMDMWVTAFPPIQQWWQIPGWLVERHAGYMSAYPTGGRDFGSIATLVLQLIGVTVLWKRLQRQHLFLLWGALPFLFVAAAIQDYPYGGSVRVAIFLAPAICICTGAGLAAIAKSKSATHVVCALMATMMVAGIYRDFKQPYKNSSDLAIEQFVEQLAAEPKSSQNLLGHLPNPKLSFLDYGGGLARLRYQLMRAFNTDAQWYNHPQDLNAIDADVIQIEYHGYDLPPTVR